MWTHILFGVFLVVVSGSMLLRHGYVWRMTAVEGFGGREREYLRQQCRRRIQASALIAIVGLMIAGGHWIQGPLATATYWGMAAALVLWIGLLALADLTDTRYYYRTAHRDQLREQADLCAHLERWKSRAGDGPATLDADNGDTDT
jgi:hypothetical protein